MMKLLPFMAVMALLSAESSAEIDCSEVAKEFSEQAKANPASLLMLVDESILAAPGCECEIVRAGIETAGKDKDLVGQIVSVAVSNAPSESAKIAECALAAMPEAAQEIKGALSETFEGAKAPIPSAKQPYDSGKEPVYSNAKEVIIDQQDDFSPAPATVSGVYLIAPIASSSGYTDRVRLARELGISLKELDRILKKGGKTLVEILRRRPRNDKERDPRDESTPSQQTP